MSTTRRGFLAALGLGALAAKVAPGGTAVAKAAPVPKPSPTEWTRDGWREPAGPGLPRPVPEGAIGYALTGSTAKGVVIVAVGDGACVRCECRTSVLPGDLLVMDSDGQVARV